MGTTLIATTGGLTLLYGIGLLLHLVHPIVGFLVASIPIAGMSAYIFLQTLGILSDFKKPSKAGAKVFMASIFLDVIILMESYFYWQELPIVGIAVFVLSVLCFVVPAVIIGLTYIVGPALIAGDKALEKASNALNEALPDNNKYPP